MPILWVFEADVFVVQKGLFAISTRRKSLFYNFFFTTYDMGIQRVVRGNMQLLMVTGGYKRLQGVTRGYKG